MHIPKTAGTSLRLVFEKNLKSNEVFPDSNFISNYGGYPPVGELLNYNSEISKSKVFLGHYPLRWIKKHHPDFNCITFLRNPVERTISHIRHIKIHQEKYANRTFDEILTDGHFRRQFENLQTRYLLNSDVKGYIETEHLDQAKEQLKSFYFVGSSENFYQDLILLASKLGLKNIDNIKSNVFAEKTEASKNDGLNPRESTIEKIKEMNRYDIELYKYLEAIKKDI